MMRINTIRTTRLTINDQKNAWAICELVTGYTAVRFAAVALISVGILEHGTYPIKTFFRQADVTVVWWRGTIPFATVPLYPGDYKFKDNPNPRPSAGSPVRGVSSIHSIHKEFISADLFFLFLS
jgi:hypothetical protein